MKRKHIPTRSAFGAEFGYSRAVRVDRHVHVAGTCAQPPARPGRCLRARPGARYRSSPKRSTKPVPASTTWCERSCTSRMRTHAAGVTRAHHEVFGEILPASTLVIIAALLKPHLVVEIEAYAILP